MNKTAVVIGLAAAFAGLASGQRLKTGEQAIFLKSGDKVVGAIVGLDGARLTLQLGDGTEIQLRDVWMINFVTDGWDFPRERDLIETNEHYVFLKSGDVSSGRITDFNGEKRDFLFETGEKFAFGAIRRIYFSKSVPRSLR